MLLVWVLFGVGGDVGVLFGEDADDVGSTHTNNITANTRTNNPPPHPI